jgi:hypothetical protein
MTLLYGVWFGLVFDDKTQTHNQTGHSASKSGPDWSDLVWFGQKPNQMPSLAMSAKFRTSTQPPTLSPPLTALSPHSTMPEIAAIMLAFLHRYFS